MLNFGSVAQGGNAGNFWTINPNNPNDITINNCSGIAAQLPSDSDFSQLLSSSFLGFKSALFAWLNNISNKNILTGIIDAGIAKVGALYSYDSATGDTAFIGVNNYQKIDVGAQSSNGNNAAGISVDSISLQNTVFDSISNKKTFEQIDSALWNVSSESNNVVELKAEQDINGHRLKNSGGVIFEILKNGDIRTNQTVAHNPAYNHQTSMLPIYDEAGVFKGMVMLYTT